MEIILIAAIASNRVMGDSLTNDIPWRVKGEQLHFKETTMGHPMIMGRKTYESIGRPLPGRQSIIVTRNPNYLATGCSTVHSPEEALELCRGNRKVFIIGGAEIYRQTMPLADTIILTELSRAASGDIMFPDFSPTAFTVSKVKNIAKPEPYTITTYRRHNDKKV